MICTGSNMLFVLQYVLLLAMCENYASMRLCEYFFEHLNSIVCVTCVLDTFYKEMEAYLVGNLHHRVVYDALTAFYF